MKELAKIIARLAVAPAAGAGICHAVVPGNAPATPVQAAVICCTFAAVMVVNLLIVIKK